MPLIAVVQKEISKLAKAAMKVEDEQLSYDADSEASEEEGHRKLTTTPLTTGKDDGASTGNAECGRGGARAESWKLSRGHHRVRRKASLPKYFFGQGTKHGSRAFWCVFPGTDSDSDDMKPSKHGEMRVRHKCT